MEQSERVKEEFYNRDSILRMHPSQSQVWQKLVSNRLQLVWGPPGTG